MNATLDIVIRCTDSGTPPLYRDQLFTIFIKNVNEKPTKIVVQGGVSPENRQEHVVASFFTVDPDDESVVTEVITCLLTADVSQLILSWFVSRRTSRTAF